MLPSAVSRFPGLCDLHQPPLSGKHRSYSLPHEIYIKRMSRADVKEEKSLRKTVVLFEREAMV